MMIRKAQLIIDFGTEDQDLLILATFILHRMGSIVLAVH